MGKYMCFAVPFMEFHNIKLGFEKWVFMCFDVFFMEFVKLGFKKLVYMCLIKYL